MNLPLRTWRQIDFHLAKSPVLSREARLVPDASALEPQVERRHPGVGPLAHRPAGHGEGAVDLAVLPQLGEEDGDGLLHRLHGDLALHGHHRRHARLGQVRSERRLGGAVRRAAALAGGEDHEPRRRRQLADALGQRGSLDAGDVARVVLEEQVGGLAARQGAMADQVEDVDPIAQAGREALEGQRLLAAQHGAADVAETLLGAGDLAVAVDGGQLVAGRGRAAPRPR